MTNPPLLIKNAGYGETPPCPQAKFKRGDVVRIRRLKALVGYPEIAVVMVAIPPNFSPTAALADLLGQPRPLMVEAGRKVVQYILANEGDERPYLVRERYLIATGETVEIGTVTCKKD